MDPWISHLLTGLTCTLAGGWLGYRLRLGGEALDRRRLFRARLRELALEAGGCHPLQLWKFHRETCSEFQRLRLGVLEDIPLWKQRRFRERCERFRSMGKAELEPEQGGGKELFQSQRTALVALLEWIAEVG